MRFDELPVPVVSFRLRPLGARVDISQYKTEPVVRVELSQHNDSALEIRTTKTLFRAVADRSSDLVTISQFIATHPARLAELSDMARDGSFQINIAGFSGVQKEMRVEIGMDEACQSARDRIRSKRTDQQNFLPETFVDRFVYKRGGDVYFFVKAGRAADSEMESVQEFVDLKTSGLAVIGDGMHFFASEKVRPDGSSILMMTGLTSRHPGGDSDRSVILVHGSLKFVDWTKAQEEQMSVRIQMKELLRDTSSYLSKWIGFNDFEGELLLRKAREIGVLCFEDVISLKDGITVMTLKGVSPKVEKLLAIGEVRELQYVEDEPRYLVDPDLRFADLMEDDVIQEDDDDGFDFSDLERGHNATMRWWGKGGAGSTGDAEVCERQRSSAADQTFKIVSFNEHTHKLELKTGLVEFPDRGMLVYATIGSLIQFERRALARKYVVNGQAANPSLGPLIEEKGPYEPGGLPLWREPMSRFISDEFFSKGVTPNQRNAIDAALNTPDIALIQGPPGTGKTTVIAAIYARLFELANYNQDFAGTVLLSGFQHDAVENMTGRMKCVNSIPIHKFGRRSSEMDEDGNSFDRELVAWKDAIAKEIRRKNPELVKFEEERKIDDICFQYCRNPTRRCALDLVRAILSLDVTILGEELTADAKDELDKLAVEDKVQNSSTDLIGVLRNIRTTLVGFRDDGPERAEELLDEWEDELTEDEMGLVQEAADWTDGDDLGFLPRLEALKRSLLVRSTEPPEFRVEQVNGHIVELAKRAREAIRKKGVSADDLRSLALLEFLRDLEGNSQAIEEAIDQYGMAFAATCQQSAGDKIKEKKNIKKGVKSKLPTYDYVIVDEAARVGPLDLLIAMAQGKRILLVGDHRQLPQLVDENKIRQMEDEQSALKPAGSEAVGEGVEDPEWYKSSMFQYLFTRRIPELEKNPKWKLKGDLSRCVTLNVQYRMHPVLGDFVSRNFYERYNKNEAFSSGRPASDFVHSLPGTEGRPAMWIDVQGDEPAQRDGTSWVRQIEQTTILSVLRKWKNCEEGKGLTFGVISFYKAQTDAIYNVIKEEFADDLKGPDPKLRIGTVDSFQGMEFDVVFLSVVRTPPEEGCRVRHPFGHLVLYNRLNVAMSRQKRLLVVVGDSRLLQVKDAASIEPEVGIPGLVDFYRLCAEEGVIQVWH